MIYLPATLTLTSQYSHGLPPSPGVNQRVNRPSPDWTGTYSEPSTSCTLHMLLSFDVAPHADLERERGKLGLPSSSARPRQPAVLDRRLIYSHRLRDSIALLTEASVNKERQSNYQSDLHQYAWRTLSDSKIACKPGGWPTNSVNESVMA